MHICRGESQYAALNALTTAIKYGMGVFLAYQLNRFPRLASRALPTISIGGMVPSALASLDEKRFEKFTPEYHGIHSGLRVIQAFTAYKFFSLAFEAWKAGETASRVAGLATVGALSGAVFPGALYVVATAGSDRFRKDTTLDRVEVFAAVGLGLLHPQKVVIETPLQGSS